MKTISTVGVVLLVLGLIALLPSMGSAQIVFGAIEPQNLTYAQGVMGGASSGGSGLPRQVNVNDNIVIHRATEPLPPVLAPVLCAQPLPYGGIILPPILLCSVPLMADPGLVPFSPARTVGGQGAY